MNNAAFLAWWQQYINKMKEAYNDPPAVRTLGLSDLRGHLPSPMETQK